MSRIAKVGGLVLAMAVASTVSIRGNSRLDQASPQRASNGAAVFSNAAARNEATGVFINQRELTAEQVWAMMRIYRFPPPRGHFWYDSTSGLYGVWGQEAAGYIRPGHDFGRLAANASAGNTSVFINGREINRAELSFLQMLFNGQVRQGRVWLDGYTWNIGIEGTAFPIANLALAVLQQQQQHSQGTSWAWRDGSGAAMASDGKCTMMAVPGAPVYGTSGCN